MYNFVEHKSLFDTAEEAELAAVELGQENQELEPGKLADCILGTAVLVEEQSVGCSLLRDPSKTTDSDESRTCFFILYLLYIEFYMK